MGPHRISVALRYFLLMISDLNVSSQWEYGALDGAEQSGTPSKVIATNYRWKTSRKYTKTIVTN